MKKISYKEAAERLGIPLGTLYSMKAKGQVPYHVLGPKLVRFDVEELDEWMAANHFTPPLTAQGSTNNQSSSSTGATGATAPKNQE